MKLTVDQISRQINLLDQDDVTKLKLISYFSTNDQAVESIINAGTSPDFYAKHSLVLSSYDEKEVDGKRQPAESHKIGFIFENGIQIYPKPVVANPIIGQTIRVEERKFEQLIRNCEHILKKIYTELKEISAVDMVNLKQTHGCDPTIAEAVFGDVFPESFHKEFDDLWEKHCKLGLAGLKKVIVVAKTKDE